MTIRSACVGLALLIAPAVAAPEPPGELGFVYVESNVGGASGGHFAPSNVRSLASNLSTNARTHYSKYFSINIFLKNL